MTTVSVEQRGAEWVAVWRDPMSQRRKKQHLGPVNDLPFDEAMVQARIIEDSFKAAERRVRAIQSPTVLEEAATVGDLLSIVQADKDYLSRKTHDSYRASHNALLYYFGQDRPLSSIGPADALNFRWALSRGEVLTGTGARARKFGDRPSEGYVWRVIKDCNSMFKCALLREYTLTNPFRELHKKYPRKMGEIDVIPLRDLWRLVYALPSWQLQNAAALCAFCGLRVNEAEKLRWRDVDFPHNRITICPHARPDTTKYRLRKPPIEPKLIPTGMYKFLLARSQRDDRDAVMVCGGLGEDNLRYAIRAAYESIGLELPTQPTHVLRKSWASRIASTYTPAMVEKWLGHSMAVHFAHYDGIPPEAYDLPPGVEAVEPEEDRE